MAPLPTVDSRTRALDIAHISPVCRVDPPAAQID